MHKYRFCLAYETLCERTKGATRAIEWKSETVRKTVTKNNLLFVPCAQSYVIIIMLLAYEQQQQQQQPRPQHQQ